MTAYNVVRFRTKPGKDRAFIEAHAKLALDARGFRRGALIETGDRTFCFVGEWDDVESFAAARPTMASILDGFRDLLEDLGGGLGLTHPVSGTVVTEVTAGGMAS